MHLVSFSACLIIIIFCEGVENICRTAYKTKQDYQIGFATPTAHKKIASL
jgi:hypothetical protein